MCAYVSFYVTENSVQRCGGRGSGPRSTQFRRVETAAFSKAGTGENASHISPIRSSRPSADHPFWKTTRALQSSVSTILSSFSTISSIKNPFHLRDFSGLVQYSSLRSMSFSARSAASLAQPSDSKLEQAVRDGSNGKSGDRSSARSGPESAKKDTSTLQPFLRRADYLEVQYTSMMADLSNMAYEVGKINPDMLRENHNLTIVATSNSCTLGLDTSTPRANSQPYMRSSPLAANQHAHFPTLTPQHAGNNAPLSCTVLVGLDAAHQNPNALLSLSLNSAAIDPAASHMALSHVSETGPAIPMVLPVEYTNHPEEYAQAIQCPVASLSLMAEQQWLHSYLSSQYALPSLHGCSEMGTSESMASQPQPELVSDLNLVSSSQEKKALPRAEVNPESLTDWFACDDPVTHTRYFSIKGSDSMEHWQINLQFDPVEFESPDLGVRIHNGVYEAALKLYDDLLPLVRQHVATSPFATVCFTGHSLGGSLASVLMLLFVQRGELPVQALSPCYTFGAPAVFCGGASAGASSDSVELQHSGLLSRLGLCEDMLVNVIMHKDICPRAFACDYSLVADVLKLWMPSFKDHSTLQPTHSHKPLYNFIGRVAVLRPDDDAPFVIGDAHHPMLPDTPGLYKLYKPSQKASGTTNSSGYTILSMDGVSSRHFASGVSDDSSFPSSSDLAAEHVARELEVHALSHSFSISTDGKLSPPNSRPASRRSSAASYTPGASSSGSMHSLKAFSEVSTGESATPPETSMDESLLQFMNNPHPLKILCTASSYGHNGAISRYHNPESYITGLVRVAQLKKSGLQSLTGSQDDL